MANENPTPKPRNYAHRQPLAVWFAVAFCLGIGLLDYETGRHIAIVPFYLVPVCLMAWKVGRNAGYLLAAVSALTWLVVDVVAFYNYGYPPRPYWNAMVLMGIFVIFVRVSAEMRQSHNSLEEIVLQRTADLRKEMMERKRLEIAKNQAERLAVVGTMAAEMAHEIRNPLSSLSLNLDLIQKEIGKLAKSSRHAPDESGVLVNEMRTEVRRIQHVLEDYLQFARFPKLQRQPLAVNEWLGKKLTLVSSEFVETDVELRTSFDQELPIVNADADQLWQAILNLIRNGVEAMPNGGTLAVSTLRDDTRVLIRVQDNGRGMTGEQREKIFMPFFTTKTSGTGLGLTLVQQIITEHGGYVECESSMGKGSTFILILPITEKP